MNKQNLIQAILEKLERELAVVKEAAKATLQAATHEESKPENEYDTRGLEASYLAGAQAKRVSEIEQQILIYKHLEPKSFSGKEPISSGALVQVDLEGKKTFVFVMSKGGGLVLPFEGQNVQVVTPNSPLGEALLGLKVGDTALVEIGDDEKEYEILKVE